VDPAKVNWTSLSAQSKASLKLATLIFAGFSPAEVGAVYGISTRREIPGFGGSDAGAGRSNPMNYTSTDVLAG
jgi:hypothetical protein